MNNFKLVIFDMDGTLLKGRGIFVIAEKKGFYDELIRFIRDDNLEYYERSIEIARLSKGYHIDEYLEIFSRIPFQNHVEYVIKNLKKQNIKTAIVTDSYQFLADNIKMRLGIDYAFANKLITDKNIFTGDLEIHNKELREDFTNRRIYSICKSYVLENLGKQLDIPDDEIIAIGDGIVDIGMIKKSGLGIAFDAPIEVQRNADVCINDMRKILEYI